MPARQEEEATTTIQNASKLYIYPAYVSCTWGGLLSELFRKYILLFLVLDELK